MNTLKTVLICAVFCTGIIANAQNYKIPPPPEVKELKMVRGKTDTVSLKTHVLVGVVPKGAQVWVNKQSVKVYKTGSFGYEATLQPGNNAFEIETLIGDKKDKTNFSVFYQHQPKPLPPADLIPEQLTLFPEGKKLWITEGASLKIRLVTKSGANVSWYKGDSLFEVEKIGQDRSVYQGYRLLDHSDMLYAKTSVLSISDGQKTKEHLIGAELRILSEQHPITAGTKTGAFLNESWGGDRLGGSKINYIDSGIVMQVLGKIDALYKVRLSDRQSAYIPEAFVELLPEGNYAPSSLTGSWSVSKSGKFDLITIPLPARHPYTVYQDAELNQLVVDLYGVTCNTNWITQYETQEIKNVDLRQVSPEVLRITVSLKDKNSWGYTLNYKGNSLVIGVKHKPNLSTVTDTDWSGLTFAVDAGHGGPNSKGAVSPAGYMEKDQNLAMSYMLKEELEKRGAKVVLTRPKDEDVKMDDRKAIVSKAQADFLISIHCNAGGNPLRTGGTSTYYKHIGYRGLSTAILDRLLELPVQNFGNVGHFNFSLNAITNCPNTLVETLFMSNLEDEERITDPAFQRLIMEKVAMGINDYLQKCK